MSNTKNDYQQPGIENLVNAINRNMNLSDGGRRSFRALALLLALSLQHEQLEQGAYSELKDLSNDLLSLIEFYDECVLFHESNMGRAQQ